MGMVVFYNKAENLRRRKFSSVKGKKYSALLFYPTLSFLVAGWDVLYCVHTTVVVVAPQPDVNVSPLPSTTLLSTVLSVCYTCQKKSLAFSREIS